MEKTTIKIEGMSCDHCVQAVTGAVSALPGISSVRVDLEGGSAAVEYDPARSDIQKIKAAIEDQGFDVV